MSGATVASIATAVATSAASAAVSQGVGALLGGGGGGASGGGGGGGSGIQANEQKFYSTDASNQMYGVHVGTTPMSGKQPQQNPEMPINGKAPAPKGAENPRATPTQAVGMDQARSDYKDQWADHLSKYLSYNTRGLG